MSTVVNLVISAMFKPGWAHFTGLLCWVHSVTVSHITKGPGLCSVTAATMYGKNGVSGMDGHGLPFYGSTLAITSAI